MDELKNKSKDELIALLKKLQQGIKIQGDTTSVTFDATSVSFDLLAQTSSSAILIYKKDCVCYVNDAAAKLTGYSREELLKMKFWEVIHPDQRDFVFEQGMARLEGRSFENRYEFRVLTKNGETRWVDYTANTLTIGGESFGIGVALDITEKIEALNKISLKNQQRVHFQKVLLDLSIKKYSSFSDFYKKITESISTNTEVERISIWLFNGEQDILSCEDLFKASVRQHEKEAPIESKHYPVYFQALRENLAIVATEAVTHPQTSEFANDYLRPLNIVSMIDIPIRSEGNVIGVICCEQVGSERIWTEEEQDFISAVAELVASNIELFRKKEAEALLAEAYQKLKEAYSTLKDREEIISLEREQLEITLRSIGDGVITTDICGRITMINKTTEILTGWSQSDAIGKRIEEVFNIVNELTGKPCENPVDKVIKTGNVVGLANHTALISKKGDFRIISDSAAPIKDKNGNISGIILVFSDNTEQKRAEEQLRESEESYRTLFESANDAIFIVHDGLFTACNEKATEILHCGKEEIIGKSPWDFSPEFQPDGKPSKTIVEEHDALVLDGIPLNFEWTHLRFDKTSFIAEVGLVKIHIHGKPYIQVTTRDITERKKTEKELIESENLLHNIIDTANIAMAIVGFDGTIEYINKQAVKTFGYAHEDIPTMDKWWVLAYPEENYRKKVVDQYMGLVYKAIEGGKEIERREYYTTCKDGSIKTMVIFGVIVNDKVFVMFDDITERKSMEEELQKSEELYRTTFENTGTATVLIEEDTTISFANAKFENLSKYSKKEIEGKKRWTDFVVKEDLERMQEQHRLRREKREAALKKYEFRFVAGDGEIRNILLTIDLIPGTKKSVASLLDITDRKQEEDALRESEEKYRSLVETTDTGYVIIDDKGNVLDANPKYVNLAGYSTLDEIMNRNVLEWTADRSKTKNLEAVKQCATQGFIRNLEIEYIHKDRKIIPVVINATVVKSGSGTIILALTNDISERKNAEEALIKSQKLFQTLAEVAPVGVFRTRADGYTTYVNPKWCELSGFSFENALGDGWLAAVHPDDREKVQNKWNNDTDTQNTSAAEYRFLKKDGSIVWVMGNAVPEWNDGEIIGYIGTITDITERRKSEEILKESEEKFRLLYSSMDQAVTLNEIITDKNGNPIDYRIIEANPSFEKHTGLKTLDILGKSILSVLPNTEKYWIDVFGETALTGKPIRLENYSSELKRYFDFYVYSPKKGQFALVSTDITERKKEERQKELNKVRLEAVLRLNNMLSLPVNEITNFALESAVNITESGIGYIGFVNEDETMLQLNSWSKQTMEECGIENKNFDFEVNKTGLLAEAIRQRKPVIINNYSDKNDLKRGLPKGHVGLSNHLNVPIFDKEKIVLLIGVGNKPSDYDDADIRQLTMLMNSMWGMINRKKTEEALRESEKRYRLVTDNTKDIITKFGTDGLITFISPACINLLGYQPEELISVRVFSLFHPDDIPYLREYEKLLLGSEASHLIKHRLRTKNGDYLWFETNNQLILNSANNEIKEIVAVSRDISEIIKAEEFRTAKEAAEFANKAKSDFLANMSHEIRNPMNAIIGLTNSLDRLELDESQKEIVRALKISSSSLLNILNDILDFSKIEANKTELFETKFSIDNLLDEVYAIFKTTAEQKKLVFSTYRKQNIPPVLKGDSVKLKQILINLCGNAIKFTEQGSVSLEVSAASISENTIELEFKIIDTGIGIKEQDFEKLFSSFTQLDSSTTKTFSGTGLGLAIVKKYLELMNGNISVSSKVDVGSTFTFTLPFTIVSEKEKTLIRKKKLKNIKMKLKILLAEDDGINQMYLKSFLNDQGWEVDTAFNGLQALEKFDKTKYDIVLMDGQMPKMDGFEATRKIREREKTLNIHTPIIAITGYAVSGDKEKFLDSGMDDYISKPVNETALIEMIISYVSPAN
jgi:PAS domain S-box-containing protein